MLVNPLPPCFLILPLMCGISHSYPWEELVLQTFKHYKNSFLEYLLTLGVERGGRPSRISKGFSCPFPSSSQTLVSLELPFRLDNIKHLLFCLRGPVIPPLFIRLISCLSTIRASKQWTTLKTAFCSLSPPPHSQFLLNWGIFPLHVPKCLGSLEMSLEQLLPRTADLFHCGQDGAVLLQVSDSSCSNGNLVLC